MPTRERTSGEADLEAVREACIRAAVDAYEDAGIQGLCAEGRWEAAIAAIRRLDLQGPDLFTGSHTHRSPGPSGPGDDRRG